MLLPAEGEASIANCSAQSVDQVPSGVFKETVNAPWMYTLWAQLAVVVPPFSYTPNYKLNSEQMLVSSSVKGLKT